MEGRTARMAVVGAVVAALAAPAVAQASDESLRAVIARAEPRLTKDEGRILEATGRYLRTRDAAPLRRAVSREIGHLEALQAAVRREDASTAHGTRGKRLVVSGLRSIISGYRRLGAVLTNQDPAAAKAEAAKATRAARRGRAALQRGIRLLG
jgi:hypothetical protein